MRNDYVKILNVIFDNRLNLEKHINRVVSACNANLSLCEIKTLSLFKKRLKAYNFNLALEDVTTVWYQYFDAYSCGISTFVVY